MSKKTGVHHYGEADKASGGKASAPMQSDSAVVGGFRKGIDGMMGDNKDAIPVPATQKVSASARRTTGFGPGFHKPGVR